MGKYKSITYRAPHFYKAKGEGWYWPQANKLKKVMQGRPA